MEQNQNPYQPQYPQGQQVNQAGEPYAQGIPQNAPYQQPVQGQWQGAPGMNHQQPYGQGMPQQPGQQQAYPQQAYPQQAYPQQPYAPQAYAPAYAGQYGYAPRRRVNPAVIILPIVAVVVIVGIILLVVFLSGGGSKSIASYNSNNPFNVSVEDSSGNDVSGLVSVRTGDRRAIEDAILTSLFEDYSLGLVYDINDVDRSVEFIIGEPLCLTYDSDDIRGSVTLTYDSVSSTCAIVSATLRSNGTWDINMNDSFSPNGFSWSSSESRYLVVVDAVAMTKAIGFSY